MGMIGEPQKTHVVPMPQPMTIPQPIKPVEAPVAPVAPKAPEKVPA